MSSYYKMKVIDKWWHRSRVFHCHDEEEFCRTGDKVVIRRCRKLTPSKYYYVRNVILSIGRNDFMEKDLSVYEREAIKSNEELRAKDPALYFK